MVKDIFEMEKAGLWVSGWYGHSCCRARRDALQSAVKKN